MTRASALGPVRERLPRDTRGGSLVQYLVVLGLVALAAVGAFTAYGATVGGETSAAAGAVAGLTSGGESGCVGEACANGSNCFVAGTPVETAEGPRPIESVAVGDRVLSADTATGEVRLERVLHTFVSQTQELVDVGVAAQSGEADHVRATPEHPFLTVNRGWVRAAHLARGDRLTDANGDELAVAGITRSFARARVFNFEVDRTHTYFVGDARVLVHNQGVFGRVVQACGRVLGQGVPRTPVRPPVTAVVPHHQANAQNLLDQHGVQGTVTNIYTPGKPPANPYLASQQGNFQNGVMVEVTPSQPVPVHRVYGPTPNGGGAGMMGGYWTPGHQPPGTEGQFRKDSAVLPSWNGATDVATSQVKPGSSVIIGEVGGQKDPSTGQYYPGGGTQILVDSRKNPPVVEPPKSRPAPWTASSASP